MIMEYQYYIYNHESMILNIIIIITVVMILNIIIIITVVMILNMIIIITTQ